MDLDHLFVLVDPNGPELDDLRALGLVETYRRKHPGQGTENMCFAFDNLYLELLWVSDPQEARSPSITRTGLFERSLWRTEGTCRFGIAWRETEGEPTLAAPVWSYEPPYLPPGMSIAVAVDSDDPRMPLMFRSPGTSAPTDWPAERRGELQRGAGLGRVVAVSLTLPADIAPSAALRSLAASTDLDLRVGPSSLALEVERRDGSAPLVLEWQG